MKIKSDGKWKSSEKKIKIKTEVQIQEIVSRYQEFTQEESSNWKRFDEIPLSHRTLIGLEKCGYTIPTEIQRDSIGLALRGLDILGAAKTGSGKTLAFLIPVLECLWRNRWSKVDGLGALIIAPTRELAYQTFQVLRKIGSNHDTSAALLIGGTDLAFERGRIAGTNIVICTPGRLLQHMDENSTFSCDNLQILVLDEADRILDMGFRDQINAIVGNLPFDRQTLLFSATQTKSVRDLVRLSLKEPVFVSVHEHSDNCTPDHLTQNYAACTDESKLNVLWSFLTHHKHKKTLVFLGSCRQVRFVFESFRHLRPGLPIIALHGSMNQSKRVAVYEEFSRTKHAALFATDVAARGLDFPQIDWVLHVDCPPDVDEYIHRSGRTARAEQKGQSLLLLTPTKHTNMVAKLTTRRIPIQQIHIDPDKLTDITMKLQSLLVRFPTLKDYAQKSFVAYLRSVFLMKHKDIFDAESINSKTLARSYGLAIAPRIRFMRKKKQNEEKMGAKCNSVKKKDSSDEKPSIFYSAENDDHDEQILTVSRNDIFHVLPENAQNEPQNDQLTELPKKINRKRPVTKVAIAKKMARKKIQVNKKTRFNDQAACISEKTIYDDDDDVGGLDISQAREEMKIADKLDRATDKEKRRAIKMNKKRKVKERQRGRKDIDEDFVFGDSEVESLDLSWLPDPDKNGNTEESLSNFDSHHNSLNHDEELARRLLLSSK